MKRDEIKERINKLNERAFIIHMGRIGVVEREYLANIEHEWKELASILVNEYGERAKRWNE